MAPPIAPPPPAPPMPSGMAAQESLLPTKSLPAPNSKMINLHWKKVGNNKILGDTVWNEILNDKTDEKFKLDAEELEEMFGKKERKKKDGADSEKAKKPTIAKVDLVDAKRAYTVDIAAARLALPPAQLAQAILRCDDDVLTVDLVQQLIVLLPTTQEIKKVVKYMDDDGDLRKLQHSASFFYQFKNVPGCPDLTTRMEMMLFRLQWQEEVVRMEAAIKSVLQASHAARTSENLKQLFGLILSIGNYMNHGSHQGAAYGFQLSTISSLKSTKSPRSQMTLLHYIVQYVLKNKPEIREVTEDLASVMEAKKQEQATIQQEIAKFGGKVMLLKKALVSAIKNSQDGDRFMDVMGQVLDGTDDALAKLKDMLDDALTKSKDLAVYFGETVDTSFKWDTIFFYLSELLEAVPRAEAQLGQWEEAEAKKIKREQWLEQRKTQMHNRKVSTHTDKQKLKSVVGQLGPYDAAQPEVDQGNILNAVASLKKTPNKKDRPVRPQAEAESGQPEWAKRKSLKHHEPPAANMAVVTKQDGLPDKRTSPPDKQTQESEVAQRRQDSTRKILETT
eukprot:gb/GEZN01003958.1/.p1 GENE.gb/GEZN01003958.1/~~gb/GEZN01003958.1/.p1  ORF type:complete len:622 (+),score=170.84 gb/GEZN01003958.1/:183-1868(+)